MTTKKSLNKSVKKRAESVFLAHKTADKVYLSKAGNLWLKKQQSEADGGNERTITKTEIKKQ
jgi:hypothetical protein